MGAISDRIATMQGCSLRQIVDEIARMEAETLDVGEDDFAKLWALYPNKTAKKAAEKMYRLARKRGVSHQTMADGIIRYVATKPADRPWMHLSTFINGERWEDQPAQIKPKGLAGVRAELQQEIAYGERGTSATGDHHSNAGRLAIGGRLDDERNRGRLL